MAALNTSAWLVKKFGGTSLGSVAQIDRICQYLSNCYASGERFVLVASAMAGETNRLVGLAIEMDDDPCPEYYDRLFATGEQAAIALLAIGLKRLGVPVRPMSGQDVPIWTDGGHAKARVHHVDSKHLNDVLTNGEIPIVAGCQGVDIYTKRCTTLGRGGSDTSAVAIAVALGSIPCEIFTDVEGVYSTDPRICKQARVHSHIDYMTMMELASLGAKVLQIRAVDLAYRYDVPIHVRSAFSWKEGTMIVSEKQEAYERLCVSHVTIDENQSKIMVSGLPTDTTIVPKILSPLANHKINIDMIVESFSGQKMDVYFTVGKTDYDKAFRITEEIALKLGATDIVGDEKVAKVSALGSGMMDHYGVASKFFEILAQHDIPVYLTSTSEIKISVLVPKTLAKRATEVLHRTFIEEAWDPIKAYEENSTLDRQNMDLVQ